MKLKFEIMPPKDFDLNEFLELTETHLSDYSLSNEWIANHLGVSDRQLYYKVKEQLGMTPRQYINQKRLEKAYDLLHSKTYHTVGEVANEVGFFKTSYFSDIFERAYGIRPKEILKSQT